MHTPRHLSEMQLRNTPPPRPDGTSPRVFVGVAATDFFFSDVNTYLAQG